MIHYEIEWIKKAKRSDIRRAGRFANLFRFNDDLTLLNNNTEFEESFKKIFPTRFVLKKD